MSSQPIPPTPNTAEQPAGKGLDGAACSVSDPLRIAWSEDELIETARKWLVHTYGKPCAMKTDTEKDRFCERLGMMVDFITDQYPQNAKHIQPDQTPNDNE